MENLIIHISGASGSGKTTLGNKLKEHFKSKIIVKDLDELLDEHFIDYFGKKSSHNIGDVNEKAYQKYIDDYINKQKKPIIFVGLNDNFVDFYPKRKNIYYNLHTTTNHPVYIDIDDNIINSLTSKFYSIIPTYITKTTIPPPINNLSPSLIMSHTTVPINPVPTLNVVSIEPS